MKGQNFKRGSFIENKQLIHYPQRKGDDFMYQFKGFTEKANKALNLAIESAEEMRHNYVGTEHILYGLVKRAAVLPQPLLMSAE